MRVANVHLKVLLCHAAPTSTPIRTPTPIPTPIPTPTTLLELRKRKPRTFFRKYKKSLILSDLFTGIAKLPSALLVTSRVTVFDTRISRSSSQHKGTHIHTHIIQCRLSIPSIQSIHPAHPSSPCMHFLHPVHPSSPLCMHAYSMVLICHSSGRSILVSFISHIILHISVFFYTSF